MRLTHWLSSTIHRIRRSATRRTRSRRSQPWGGASSDIRMVMPSAVELLEDRTLLASIAVDTTTDEDDGMLGGGTGISLREAVRHSSAGDEVILPAGTYQLSIGGDSEDGGATGDLDLQHDLTFRGAGADVTIIDANSIDRVFDIAANNLTVVFEDLRITGGVAKPSHIGGGGIRLSKSGITKTDVTFRRITLDGNSAMFVGGGIGALDGNAEHDILIEDSTVAGNSADVLGAGIYFLGNSDSSLTIVNSTISGNMKGTGTAIAASDGDVGPVVVRHSTIVNNTVTAAFSQGAISATNNDVTLSHTILANNSGGNIFMNGQSVTSLGYNISDSTMPGAVGTDLQNTPVSLDPLAANGGSTQTHNPSVGSNVIDAGDPAISGAPATDQRGLSRFANGRIDIGAVEFGAGPANSDPMITVDDLTYTEGDNSGSPVQIDNTATADDTDGDADWDGGSLTVQITANAEPADELSIGAVGGISVVGNEVRDGATGFGTIVDTSGTNDDGIVTGGDLLTINFDSDATSARVQALVRAIHYRTASETPGEAPRTVTFVATDKNSGSGNDTSIISVAGQADTFTVTTLADENDGGTGGMGLSLREALTLANSSDEADTIDFQAGLTGTITLGSDLPVITESVTITGPGAAVVTVDGDGNGIFKNSVDVTTEITDLTLTGGIGFLDGAPGPDGPFLVGGGVFNEGGTLTLRDMVITANTAHFGGGVYSENHGSSAATVHIFDTVISDNDALEKSGGNGREGGAIFNWSGVGTAKTTMTITDSTISGNSAASNGGGIIHDAEGVADSAEMTIVRTVIQNNTADQQGGGIVVREGARLTISDSTIADNTANSTTPGRIGGGFRVDGTGTTVTMQRTTISGNQVPSSGGDGGGGTVVGGAAFTATNTTFSTNHAGRYSGAVEVNQNASVTITNSTIAFNTAGDEGGGIGAYSSNPVIINNTLISNNTTATVGAAPDVSGTFGSTHGHNLFGATMPTRFSLSIGGTTTGNLTDMDPNLSPLAMNGGFTKTHAIPEGGIAEDAGTAMGAPGTDQRGNPRPQAGGVDIGAYEVTRLDFGDAPSPYPVTLAEDGPRHFAAGPRLGAERDDELDGTHSTAGNADFDDTDVNPDDEDGVASFPVITDATTTYSITATVANTTGGDVNLAGWIDFDGNGSFDTDEFAMATVANNATSAMLTWNNIGGSGPDLSIGTRFVRLRITTDALTATDVGGVASDGEVEDYPLSIVPSNNNPTITVGDLSYTEGDNSGSPVQIDNTATADDTDGDADWDGGSLTVQITANAEAADELSIGAVGGLSVVGNEVRDGVTGFGTIVETSGTNDDGIVIGGDLLTINFDSDATSARVQALVQAIHYRNTSSTPAANMRTVTFTVTDTNSGSGMDTSTITVSSVADDPVVTAPATATTVNAGTFNITGTAEANALVQVYSDADNNGMINGTDMVVASEQLMGGATNFFISTTLAQDADNDFLVTATDASTDESNPVDVPTITEDSTGPTPVISAVQINPTGASPIDISIDFGEVVNGLMIGEITVGNGTAANLNTANNQLYTLEITPMSDGVVTVDVAGGVAQDNAGNDNLAAVQFSITSDRAAPIVTITPTTTTDDRPELNGMVDDNGASISVMVAGQTLAATNNMDGTWTLADNALATLAAGVHNVTVTATDAAQNVGTDPTTNELEIAVLAFDFGTTTSPVAAGFTGVNQTTAFTAGGSGWLSTTGLESRDRTTVSSEVNRDYIKTNNAASTFAATLADGEYNVTFVIGSGQDPRNNVGISFEATQVATVTTAPGQFETQTHLVTVTGNRLEATIEKLGSSSAGLNALIILPATLEPRLDATDALGFHRLGDGPVPVDDQFVLSDPDDTNLTGAEVRITSGFVGNEDVLGFMDQNGITGSYDAMTGVLTLAGTASVANYQAALRSVTFDSTGTTSGARGLQFSASDATGTGFDSRSLTVLPAGSAGFKFDFNDGSSPTEAGHLPVTVSSVFSSTVGFGWLNDAFANNLSARDRGAPDDLRRDYHKVGSGSMTFAVDLPDGTYDVTFTIGSQQDARNGVAVFLEDSQVPNGSTTFSSTAGQFLTETHRTTVSDGRLEVKLEKQGSSGISINGLEIAEVTGAPGINLTAGSAVFQSGGGAIAIDDALTVEDLDSNDLTGATVSIIGGFDMAADTLSFTDQFGITGSYATATGILTLTGTTTVANYQAALRTVQFSTTDTSGARTIQFEVNDGTATGADTRDIFVTVPFAGTASYDFGSPTSPVEPGFTAGVNETSAFDPALGYGWLSTVNLESRVRLAPVPLDERHDYVRIGTGSMTFAVSLPNGTYDVQVTIGSSENSRHNVGLLMEGTQVDTITTALNQFATPTHRVTVNDNRLEVEIARQGSSGASINAMVITEV